MIVGVNIPYSTGGFDEKSRTAVIVLILVGLLSIPAQAQVLPGRWEKVDSQRMRTPVMATLTTGESIEGDFLASDSDGLTLRTNTGNELRLSYCQKLWMEASGGDLILPNSVDEFHIFNDLTQPAVAL